MNLQKLLLSALLLCPLNTLFSSEPPHQLDRTDSPDYVLQLDDFPFPTEPTNTVTPTEQAIVDQFGKLVIYAPARADYFKKNSTPAAAPQGECAFCRQIGEFNDEKNLILRVFEHGTVVKFNDFPYNPGQLLILPSKHNKNASDLSLEERGELIELIPAAMHLLKEKLGAKATHGGINIERLAGASIPEHLHIHLMPLFGNEMERHVKEYTQHRFSAANLQELYAKLKPSFKDLVIAKHTLGIPRSIQTDDTHEHKITAAKHDCALCLMLADNNDPQHLILRRFSHHAVLFKPFADVEGQLIIVPLEHLETKENLKMPFAAKSELIELLWPLVEIIKKTAKADGCNVSFNHQSNSNSKSTHAYTELFPRFTVEMIGYTQKLAKIEFMAKNLRDLYNAMQPHVQQLVLPEHTEESNKVEEMQ